MTRLQAVRSARPRPTTPARRSTPMDAQMRAAAILGRIIDFFDAVDAGSGDVLERTRGLLVDELEVGRTDGSRTPHENRRRSAVLTAALECVHAASTAGERGARPVVDVPAWLRTPAKAGTDRPVRAGRIMYLVLRILDGFETLQDPDTDQRPRGVDVLAHMLRGPEPRTWSRHQQAFARCALEWMKARAEDSTVAGSAGRVRWSTIARRNGGLRVRPEGPDGTALSA